MPSLNLNRFLRNLNADPSLLAALDADPDTVLAQAELSEQEQALLRSPDRYRLLQAVQGDGAAQPNF